MNPMESLLIVELFCSLALQEELGFDLEVGDFGVAVRFEGIFDRAEFVGSGWEIFRHDVRDDREMCRIDKLSKFGRSEVSLFEEFLDVGFDGE